MKVTCEIVEDLLPLYVDNVCSEQSRRAVEEHLQECDKCRKLIDSTQAVPVPHIEPNQPTADKAVKKGVLHKNTAARKISKLMKRANAAE